MTYDWRLDAIRSYAVWAAAKREQGVREGRIAPESPTEARWRAEGPRPPQLMEAGRP